MTRSRVPVVRTSTKPPVVPPGGPTAPEWVATKNDISILQQGVTRTNLRSEGLTLDGTADQWAAWQALIDAAPSGTIFTLDERANLRLDAPVSWSGKRIDIEAVPGAKLTFPNPSATPLIDITNAPKSRIAHLIIVGGETAFVGTDSTQYAIDILGSDDAVLEDVRISGTSRGARIENSNRPIVRGFDYTGLVTAWTTNVNFHTALNIVNSDGVVIYDPKGRDCGSVVLVGSFSERGEIYSAKGINTFDNGIYLASAIGYDIYGPKIIMEAGKTQNGGSAVKMRGSHNTCHGGYAEGTDSGFTMSGSGSSPDGDGANGVGSRLLGVRAKATRLNGAVIDESGGYPPREFEIVNSDFEGCGTALGSEASIRVTQGHRHIIALNHIANQLSSGAGILIAGASGNVLDGIAVTRNTIRKTVSYGFQGSFASNLDFSDNVLADITATYAARFITVTAGLMTGNRKIGTAGTSATLRINDAASTNCRVYGNHNCTLSDAGTGTIKPQTYTATNVTTDRAYDADTATVAEVADVLGTLLADLRAQGVIA